MMESGAILLYLAEEDGHSCCRSDEKAPLVARSSG